MGGPTDPELGKAAAGVGTISPKGINFYPLTNPTKDYLDAEASGRCMILCADLGGCTLTCANLYGWTGGTVGSKEAARTDDLITIVRMQFSKMPAGPKIICGDLNGSREAFPTIGEMIAEEGWTDIGNDPMKCKGRPGQFTCQANAGSHDRLLLHQRQAHTGSYGMLR